MSKIIVNCTLIKNNVTSIISKIEAAEDHLRNCQGCLADGVVLSGTSLSGDTIDNALFKLSNAKAQANNLFNACNTIITKEQKLSSSSSVSNGSSSSSGGASSSILHGGGSREIASVHFDMKF